MPASWGEQQASSLSVITDSSGGGSTLPRRICSRGARRSRQAQGQTTSRRPPPAVHPPGQPNRPPNHASNPRAGFRSLVLVSGPASGPQAKAQQQAGGQGAHVGGPAGAVAVVVPVGVKVDAGALHGPRALLLALVVAAAVWGHAQAAGLAGEGLDGQPLGTRARPAARPAASLAGGRRRRAAGPWPAQSASPQGVLMASLQPCYYHNPQSLLPPQAEATHSPHLQRHVSHDALAHGGRGEVGVEDPLGVGAAGQRARWWWW